tara:strand:- start:170 stop:640 length:471 start_codon:yes stop_codon:yes gene_type:complete
MKVIDNFLEQDSFNQFKDIITGQNFPWYFNNEKVLHDNSLNNFQFVNIFQQGNTANFLLDVFKEKLKVSNFLRAKLNCTTRTSKIFKFKPHYDWDGDCNIAIFYINSNNGYTEFETGEKIKSVENRILMFDNKLKHFGTTSTNSKTRIVLNLCYNK